MEYTVAIKQISNGWVVEFDANPEIPEMLGQKTEPLYFEFYYQARDAAVKFLSDESKPVNEVTNNG